MQTSLKKKPIRLQTPTPIVRKTSVVSKPKAVSSKKTYKIVSLFSGCGGMDLGFTGNFSLFGNNYTRLPFEIIWANDLNEHACRTYEKNLGHPIHCGDIWNFLDRLPTTTDILIGGFPCQDISVNGKGAGIKGARSGLYKAMVEAVRITKPKIFIAENVKGLLNKNNKESLEKVIKDFRALGYKVSYQLYHAADYGVPQNRERVFIVGTLPTMPEFAPPKKQKSKNEWMTAKEALHDLSNLKENSFPNHIWSKANKSPEQGSRRLLANKPAHTIRAECHGNIQFHYSKDRRISMREAARIQSFPDNFIFESKLRETERQIGNAVPPVLAWHMAQAVKDYLEGKV